MNRYQIFCIGASSIYGVGGTKGSWADLLKAEIHALQYGPEGIGQVHEVYNLAVPGRTIADSRQRTEVELKTMTKPGRKVISIVQFGGNNALAIDSPDNYVSTPEEYRTEMKEMLVLIKSLSNQVICLGSTPCDESKTTPIVKDLEKNTKVYMSNERKRLFESINDEVASELGMTFIPLFDSAQKKDWTETFQFSDGIHPNDSGYEWIYQHIKPYVFKRLGL